MLRTVLVVAVIALWGSASAHDPLVEAQVPGISAATAQAASDAPPTEALEAKAPTPDGLQPDERGDGTTPAHDEPAPAAVKSGVPRARGPRRPPQLTAEQALNERVRRLTRALGLDEAQQARLREVLVNEQREILRLRSETAHPNDRVDAALAILERTREQIRAILSDEQKKKYPAAVPRAVTAAATADVDYWMGLTRPPPAQGARQGQ